MRHWIVPAILLLAGCARHEPRAHFESGPELSIRAASIGSVAALSIGPNTTLVAWSALNNEDTTGLYPQWRGRVETASFDHSKRAWSSISTIDSMNGDTPFLLMSRGGRFLILKRSLRTFHQDASGRWAEGPGITVPRTGLVEALAAHALRAGQLGIAFDLSVPDSVRNAEVWYQVCDSVFHPIRNERVATGTRPSPSQGIATGTLEDSRAWIVSALDGAPDGVRIDVKEKDGSWTQRTSGMLPWAGERTHDIRSFAARTERREILAAAAMQKMKVLRVQPDRTWQIQDAVTDVPARWGDQPIAVAQSGGSVAFAWLGTREPTLAEASMPGGLRPRGEMSFELMGAGRDTLVVDDVSCIAMTSGKNEARLWYGTGIGADRCRIGLRAGTVR